MKKTIIVLGVLTGLFSCTKDEDLPEPLTETQTEIKVSIIGAWFVDSVVYLSLNNVTSPNTTMFLNEDNTSLYMNQSGTYSFNNNILIGSGNIPAGIVQELTETKLKILKTGNTEIWYFKRLN